MGSFPGVKWSQLDAHHPPPSTAMLRIGRSYIIQCVGLTTLPLSCDNSLEILDASCSRSPRGICNLPSLYKVMPIKFISLHFKTLLRLTAANVFWQQVTGKGTKLRASYTCKGQEGFGGSRLQIATSWRNNQNLPARNCWDQP
jgi:hypothetical protein